MELAERMKSFSTWQSPVDRMEMLVCGMYYLQVRDVVRCSHCLGVQSDWKTDERVIVQHGASFPECPAIKQLLDPLTVFYLGQYGVVAKLRTLREKPVKRRLNIFCPKNKVV